MSNIDVPCELKTFWKHFEKVAYRHDYATVFEDFITMCIPNFSFSESLVKNRSEALKKYSEKEIDGFRECFREMILVYDQQFNIHRWYDFFGDLYQAITSGYKSSKMGQFFTPVPICDMMVMMNNPGSLNKKEIVVNDPACGSGRLLISADTYSKEVHKKKLFLIGQDLDPICVKMTALNMIFHGSEGEVLCMNTLSNEFRFGYKIKAYYPVLLPQIIPIEAFESRYFSKREPEYTETEESLPSLHNEEIQVLDKEALFDLSEFETKEVIKLQHKRSSKTKEIIYQESLWD